MSFAESTTHFRVTTIEKCFSGFFSSFFTSLFLLFFGEIFYELRKHLHRLCDFLVLHTHLFSSNRISSFIWFDSFLLMFASNKFYALTLIYQIGLRNCAGKRLSTVHTQHHECLLHQTHLTNDQSWNTQQLLFELIIIYDPAIVIARSVILYFQLIDIPSVSTFARTTTTKCKQLQLIVLKQTKFNIMANTPLYWFV